MTQKSLKQLNDQFINL